MSFQIEYSAISLRWVGFQTCVSIRLSFASPMNLVLMTLVSVSNCPWSDPLLLLASLSVYSSCILLCSRFFTLQGYGIDPNAPMITGITVAWSVPYSGNLNLEVSVFIKKAFSVSLILWSSGTATHRWRIFFFFFQHSGIWFGGFKDAICLAIKIP